MSATRQPFRENPAETESSTMPSAKKMKGTPTCTPKVLTFAVSHSPVQVQLLESNTIFDLVDIICRSTTVGMDETVYDHMWDVSVPGISGPFNSSDAYVDLEGEYSHETLRKASITKLGELGLKSGMTLQLKYDYGSTTYYDITFNGEHELDESRDGDANSFPREKSLKKPAEVIEYQTDQVDLNAMFSSFNSFYKNAAMPNINLFQPGRKKNYGFVSRGNEGCKHMIYLPAKPDADLSNYLHTIDYACRFKHSTMNSCGAEFPMNSWYSMIVFPNEYNKSYGKYGEHLEPGFCDMKKAPMNPHPGLNSVFPKIAALAGYKKDKKVPKGWLSYKDKTLLICCGSAKSADFRAPPGTAFQGEGQHDPETSEAVLFQTKENVQSIHQLFCVAEGLLRTL